MSVKQERGRNEMKIESSLVQLTKNKKAPHTTEMALAIALFALVAGFGFFSFGDLLADFFVSLGGKFDTNTLAVPTFGQIL